MQVCTCCGVACGKCLANEGLLEEATRFRRALELIHRGVAMPHKVAADALTDTAPSKVEVIRGCFCAGSCFCS